MPAEQIKSLSLYVHIPFCVRKCHYCDFYSAPFDESLGDDFIDALLIEWELIRKKYGVEIVPVKTIYFGGGTPSILSLRQWKKIIEKMIKPLPLAPDFEWTIECNPDSFSTDTAKLWLDSGVTRLSLGIQSLDDNELRLLGRIHDSGQARRLLENPLLSRFASVGADLMYGIPGQTPGSLEFTLGEIIDNPIVRHLSAYELTVSEHTVFGQTRRHLPLPPEDALVAMTELILKKTAACGFEHYEISNFCRAGYACRHNETYWRHRPYIGLGPAAHSFMPPKRFSNVISTEEYVDKLRARELPAGFSETLDTSALSREMVVLGLRTRQGVSENDYLLMTGEDFSSAVRAPLLTEFVRRGMMEYAHPFWRLTETGMLFADAVARDLL
jgi:oxygen-independent coproporphyrinogen III oxidase